MYMGELVRFILVKMVKEELFFGGKFSLEFFNIGCFEIKDILDIEGEKDGIWKVCEVLMWLGLDLIQEDCVVIYWICQIVFICFVSLCVVILVVVLQCIKENKGEEWLCFIIGVDGFVYKKYFYFVKCLYKIVWWLVFDCDVCFFCFEDGSGKGVVMVIVVVYWLVD